MLAPLALLVETNALAAAAAVVTLPDRSYLGSTLDWMLVSWVSPALLILMMSWVLMSWVSPALLVLMMSAAVIG